MHYSAHMKTDAVLHLGAYALLRIIRKVFKKPIGKRGSEEIKALKDGIRRLKRETELSVYAHFKDYRENIKYQYMLRLVNATSAKLFEGLTEHFNVYVTDLNVLVDSMGLVRSDKEQLDQALQAVEGSIKLMEQQLDALRRDVNQMRADRSDIGRQAVGGTTGF